MRSHILQIGPLLIRNSDDAHLMSSSLAFHISIDACVSSGLIHTELKLWKLDVSFISYAILVVTKSFANTIYLHNFFLPSLQAQNQGQGDEGSKQSSFPVIANNILVLFAK